MATIDSQGGNFNCPATDDWRRLLVSITDGPMNVCSAPDLMSLQIH